MSIIKRRTAPAESVKPWLGIPIPPSNSAYILDTPAESGPPHIYARTVEAGEGQSHGSISNSRETEKGSHKSEFIADQHEMFASESACTAYLTVLNCTYDSSIGKPSEQVYLFVVEALCRASSKSALVPIALNLLLKFHPPEITDQFVEFFLQRGIHSLLSNALLSQDFLKRLFVTGQVCSLAELALRSHSLDPGGRFGELLNALLSTSNDSPGPSQHRQQWKTQKDLLFEQYNGMLTEDEAQSLHEYFGVLLQYM